MEEKDRKQRNRRNMATVVWAILEAFCLGCAVAFLSKGNLKHAAIAAGMLPLLLWPYAAQRLLHARFVPGLTMGLLLFTMGPLLGHPFQLYYSFPLWDDILHGVSGFLFAMVGFYIPVFAEPNRPTHSRGLQFAFAFCFALAIAAVWEFFEYGMDVFFHTDMQNDRVITGFTSYLLGEATGEAGILSSITEVVVNGKELGLGGYVDVGLIDTMGDMLLCAAGAVVFALAEWCNRGKQRAAWPMAPTSPDHGPKVKRGKRG